MQSSLPGADPNLLRAEVLDLVDRLPHLSHGDRIYQALHTLIQIAQQDLDRLDWKILLGSLEDMDQAFATFSPYRHIRKISVFGSARTPQDQPDYQMALNFSHCMAQQGYMVMTGAGEGIMQAANQGAGRDQSFGLNVELPFEQSTNSFIEGDAKLVHFKYFFTRKLFFLRETDAVAIFPGGFGTQDEAFECLTLMQTGKFGPVPLVLVEQPGGSYWLAWEQFVQQQLLGLGLISGEDRSLYTITDDLSVACGAIADFYRVYDSCRYVDDLFVMRLKGELSEAQVQELNDRFGDIVVSGKIDKSAALPQEQGDITEALPRLVFRFNQQDLGRLYQMIKAINLMGTV
jgi:uncharacterized protein (TIGR00730 family)